MRLPRDLFAFSFFLIMTFVPEMSYDTLDLKFSPQLASAELNRQLSKNARPPRTVILHMVQDVWFVCLAKNLWVSNPSFKKMFKLWLDYRFENYYLNRN